MEANRENTKNKKEWLEAVFHGRKMLEILGVILDNQDEMRHIFALFCYDIGI